MVVKDKIIMVMVEAPAHIGSKDMHNGSIEATGAVVKDMLLEGIITAIGPMLWPNAWPRAGCNPMIGPSTGADAIHRLLLPGLLLLGLPTPLLGMPPPRLQLPTRIRGRRMLSEDNMECA